MKFSKAAAASALAATASAQANYTAKCVSGLHVIVARASTEAPGFGILGPVKDSILARIPNSDAAWVPYPATLTDYNTISEPAGVGNMTKLIKEYGDACPGSKMVLMGYSQGAQVTGDTLLGNEYLVPFGMGNSTGIDSRYIKDIVAVVMMGDPANVNGLPFHVGNSTRNGVFPRLDTARWNSDGLVDKTVSYCDAEDTYCDSGKLGTASIRVHIGYIQEYGSAAADFVVSKAGGLSNSTTGGNSTVGSGSNSTSVAGSNSTSVAGSGSNSTSVAGSGSNSTGVVGSGNSTSGTSTGSVSTPASTGSSSGGSASAGAPAASSTTSGGSFIAQQLSSSVLIAIAAVAFSAAL